MLLVRGTEYRTHRAWIEIGQTNVQIPERQRAAGMLTQRVRQIPYLLDELSPKLAFDLRFVGGGGPLAPLRSLPRLRPHGEQTGRETRGRHGIPLAPVEPDP